MIRVHNSPRHRATLICLALIACSLAALPGAAQAAGDSYSERALSRAELLSLWRLGDDAGALAIDVKGGRHGTYTGGVTLGQAGALSADPDKAARFDGIDDSVTLPTLPAAASFTIAGWQRLTDASLSNNTLYGKVTGARLMPRPTGFYADAIAGTRHVLQGASATNVGVWVHWALVRSGTNLELYRNAVKVGGLTNLPAATTTDLSGQIGRQGTAYPAKATIDDVAVYSRALTAAEIAGDYAARDVAPTGDKPTPPPPPAGPFYVDGESRGAACSDTRTAAQAASVSTPWCSLERAAAEAPDASSVLVRAGTYPSVAISGSVNGAKLTFKPYAAEKPVLHGLEVTGSSRLRFEGFRITEVTDLDQVTLLELAGNDISPHDVRIVTGSDVLIEDNTFHDLTMDRGTSGRCIPPRCGYGVRINTGTDITIRNNRFQRIPADAIQSGQATRYLIEGNLFEDISPFVDPEEHSDAIQFYAGSQSVTLRSNTFRRTRGPLLHGLDAGLAQRDLVVENNLLVSQRDFGLRIANAPRLKLVNNTVWDAGSGGVILEDLAAIPEKTSAVTAVNNVIQSFSAQAGMFLREDYNLIGSGYRAGAHDLAGPPRFVDPTAGDYRLAGGSPGIDAGTSDGAPARDLTGAARVDTPAIPNSGGGAQPYYEIGALEFTAAYAPPGGSYSSRILATAGLLSYWRLGETAGTVATDERGGRHGTYRNGVTLGAAGALSGDPNTAATFDGVDDHVILPDLPASVDFTIEGWQRLSVTAAGNNNLYGRAGTLRFMPRPAGYYAGVWLGGAEYILQGVGTVNTDRWVHWALVRRGATLEVYRDGILVGTRAGLPATTAANLSGAIGRLGGVANPAKGAIDDVAVYSAALDATEIRAHRDLGAP